MQRKKRKREDTCMTDMIRFTRRNKRFKELHKHLKTLDSLVGMEELKQSIVSQIQFIITTGGKLDSHFLNTSLVGPPGTGKTTVAEMLHKIWISLNIFDDDMPFTILHRSDFVGGYMGQSCNKTRKILNKYAGSVIFIDEAYSLMTGEIIIAGYEDQINSNFFNANPGLKRRFGWNFAIKPYTYSQLFQIFVRQLKICDWTVDKKAEDLFRTHHKKFKNAGGDTENICFQSKLSYSKDNWMKKRQTRHLSVSHVQKAMEDYFVDEPEPLNMYI